MNGQPSCTLLIGSPDGQCSMANFCWNFRDFSESCTMAGVDSGQTRVPSAVFLQVFTSKSIRFSKLECEANEGSRLSILGPGDVHSQHIHGPGASVAPGHLSLAPAGLCKPLCPSQVRSSRASSLLSRKGNKPCNE